jgi:ferredoxin-NADP reductase
MRVFFEKRYELAPNVWHYFFTAERPVDYIPGQYVDFRIPHTSPDSRGMSRTFTLTSLPSEKQLSFAVKFEEPSSSYKMALARLKPGDEATLTDAMGDVVLPKSSNVPLTFVAGGLGIASFVSIMRWLTEQQEQRDITLLYAVRDHNILLFQDVLDSYPYPVDMKVFSPTSSRLSAKTIAKHTPKDGLLYLSGSEKFVESLRHELENDYNVPHEQIVFDFFDGYSEL